MAVFRVERNKGYTVMSNHHLRNKELTLIEMLIKLLRANLSIQESTISVEQELDFLESYLYIQSISRKGLLQWNCANVADKLFTQYIPKLLLQPLAENTILHGFSLQSGIGTITVSGARYGDEMILRMEDDGGGIDAQRLEQIQYALRTVNIVLHVQNRVFQTINLLSKPFSPIKNKETA